MNPVEVTQGSSAVILAMPHSGTSVPPEIEAKLNDRGRALADTDWHIPQLYEGLLPEAGIVRANFHRYVTDANRDPSGASLYPGQNTTGLVPLTDFAGEPIWREEPDEAEIQRRKIAFHALYHHMLRDVIETTKAQHGYAILYDCHSIRSQLPYLFEGTLPTLNVGTNSGASCGKAIEEAVYSSCRKSSYSHVLNGRFRGGWTTRHYGRPERNVHAIQMEIAQSSYMEEATPWRYDEDKAERLRAVLREVLSALHHLVL